MKEPIVTIKFSHSEVKKLIESLIYLRDKEAELKKPYTQLLKDLKKIDEDIVEAKKQEMKKWLAILLMKHTQIIIKIVRFVRIKQ